MAQFMFATGIENSYPLIQWRGKMIRQDELAKTGHYDRWRDDFALLKELGIEHLRYGPPYFSAHRGPDSYDWTFTDETFGALHDQNVTVIADLCH
ncbi:MAG: glycoside hydrolase family 1 protein, partial [Pyrinomonadaceae bacterium]